MPVPEKFSMIILIWFIYSNNDKNISIRVITFHFFEENFLIAIYILSKRTFTTVHSLLEEKC